MRCATDKRWLAVFMMVAWPAMAAHAQSAPTPPTATAIRAEGPVKIDGRLDEPFWSKAPVQSDFQELGRRGRAAQVQEPTEFRVAFDGQAILLGITCHQAKMDQVIANVTDRDGPVWGDDSVEIFLRHNDRFYYHFSVNSLATRFDIRAPVKEHMTAADLAAGLLWDGVWQAAARRESDRWTVEVRIPLATLDIGPTPPTAWRLNVARHFARANSNFSWAPVVEGFGDLPRHGFLKGITVEPGQFPLDGAGLTFPAMLVGENHLHLKLPAARPGPYVVGAALQTLEPGATPQPMPDQSISAADGVLSGDFTIVVTKAGVPQQLTLDITDARTHQPVLLRSHLFRAPEPLEASLDWAVYYDSDPSARVSAHLAVTPNLARGKLVGRIFSPASTTPLATRTVPITAPGDLHMDLPLGEVPPGTYRLEFTADLPQLGQWKKELWFHKVPGPFSVKP
jgi:hypothetical protein